MYIRLTTFNANDMDALVAKVEGMRDEFKSIPGLNSLRSYMNEDGSGIVIAVYDTQAAAEAGAAFSQAIWGKLASLLTALPETKMFANEMVLV